MHDPQYIDDGAEATCEVVGGTLWTGGDDYVNFIAGGLLTPPAYGGQGALEPHDQATVQTVQDGARQGSAVIATITYDAARPLCGYSVPNYVTDASLAVAPTPTPVPTASPRPTPAPVPQTTGSATGTITKMAELGLLVTQPPQGPDPAHHCEVWRGFMRTSTGETLDLAVETTFAGTFDTELVAADPTAFKRALALQTAYRFRRHAVATISYTGPVTACGVPLPMVVTRVRADVDRTMKARGRIARLSSASVVAGYGSTCHVWKGLMAIASGGRLHFVAQSRTVARRLRHAHATKTRATVTYKGPITNACGETYRTVVTHAAA